MEKEEFGFELGEYRKIKKKNPNDYFGTTFGRDEGQILIKLADGEEIPILIDFEKNGSYNYT